jgi:hypothetical protein
MKKNQLMILGAVLAVGIIVYVYTKKKPVVVAKNQDGSEKKSIKTKDNKQTTSVNSKGDYIDGGTLYDSTGKAKATLSGTATDVKGKSLLVFADDEGIFIASPDGSLLVRKDETTYVSPDGTIYINNQ